MILLCDEYCHNQYRCFQYEAFILQRTRQNVYSIPFMEITSALITKSESVSCCLNIHSCDGSATTLACFSETITTNCLSQEAEPGALPLLVLSTLPVNAPLDELLFVGVSGSIIHKREEVYFQSNFSRTVRQCLYFIYTLLFDMHGSTQLYIHMYVHTYTPTHLKQKNNQNKYNLCLTSIFAFVPPLFVRVPNQRSVTV